MMSSRGILALAALVLLIASPAAAAPTATQLSRRPIAESAAWKRLVLDRNDGLVYPQHVDVVAGSSSQVDNPDGLEAAGGAVTTIHSTGQGTPRLELDLGINTGGYVEVGITKTDGTTVHLGYSEARRFLTPDGDLQGDPSLGNDDAPGARSDDVSAAGAFRSPGIRGSQRWISLQLQGAGTVSIDYVRVREEHLHPGIADYTGHLLSSDDQLNRIWYAGAYTFANDSFKDLRPGHDKGHVVVTDGAKRDRLMWLGDLVIENLLGDYALRQGPTVVRDTIDGFSCEQGSDGTIAISSQIDTVCPGAGDGGFPGDFLPEYTAWWVIAVHDYDLFTGDDGFARRMLPVARRALAYFTSHLDANGLYPTPSAAINWHPFDFAGGEDTHTNATIYRALLDTAALERRVGDGAAAAADEQEASSLRQAMLAHLWDSGAGAFLLNASDPSANHSQDAQVEAVLDGVVTGDRATSAMRFIDGHLQTTYGVKNGESDQDPYMSNYISPYISSTELLARLGRFDTAGALSLLHREWGHIVDTDPNTTLWEKMTFAGDAASYSPGQTANGIIPTSTPFGGQGMSSLSHGWSGGPVPALSGYILGIRPVTPGFATWLVQPQPGDLSFAQGQAPTPHGVIVSRWRRAAGDRSFVLTAGGPPGTTGTVYVPLLGRGRTIARDGVPVKPSAIEGGYARFDAVAGTHTWAWSADGTGAAARTCASRRSIVVHLRHGWRSGTVRVDGRRVGGLRRGRGLRLRFPGRGRSTVTVRITARGRRPDVRRYHLCRPRLTRSSRPATRRRAGRAPSPRRPRRAPRPRAAGRRGTTRRSR